MIFLRLAAIILGPTAVFLITTGIGRLKAGAGDIPTVLTKAADDEIIKEEDSSPFFNQWVRPLTNWCAENFSNFREMLIPKDIEVKLLHAGNPLQLNIDEAYGMLWVGAGVSALIGLYLGLIMIGGVGALAAMVVLGVGGFFLFPLWLDSEADDRQREISVDMMETLDILAISVKGGMGFEEALSRFVHNITGPLGEELKTYLHEISVGVAREEALSNIVYRNSSQDLRTFVGAMIQGYQLGTPLADVLQKQAEEMRVRQLQLARELGAKATPKIALVTGLLMAPAIACLVITVFGFELAEKLGPALGLFGSSGGSGFIP